MSYLSIMDPNTGLIDATGATNKGSELQVGYKSGKPFPHVVIDDFMPPSLLEACLDSFPESADSAEASFNREQERFKRSFNPDSLPTIPRELFYSFNSRPFIKVLENITGIRGLIPDPYFLGAGFHQISQGGHLSIHADFNHHKPLNLERRINVLIYLNKDWSDAYGGQLELWDTGMKKCELSIVPSFNKCVIFDTTAQSMHGNPNPINHPHQIPRRSIALYYYTATWDGSQRSYTTQFHVRPDSGDQYDWGVKIREWETELLPPIINRGLQKVKRYIGRKLQ